MVNCVKLRILKFILCVFEFAYEPGFRFGNLDYLLFLILDIFSKGTKLLWKACIYDIIEKLTQRHRYI